MPKAKNLKYCRLKAGMTQESLADALGVTVVTIRNWEHKRTAIPVRATHRISEFFGVGFAEFCDLDLEQVDSRDIHLSDSEIEYLIMFRQLPDEIKQLVRYTITSTYERVKGEHDGI